MATFNVFIGGSGIAAAAELTLRSQAYGFPTGPIAALDTEPHAQGGVAQLLGGTLLLASNTGFPNAIRAAAQVVTQTPIDNYISSPRLALAVEKRQAAVAVESLPGAGGGLYELRGVGVLALEVLLHDPQAQTIAKQVINAAIGLKLGNNLDVYLVASIAGGTGSGLAIPILAWLQQTVNADLAAGNALAPVHYHLIIVTHTPFQSVWTPTVGARGTAKENMTRGRSGAYAARRELEYLADDSKPDPYLAATEPRLMGGFDLAIRLDSIQWIGQRQQDVGRDPSDAFWEAGRVLALLQDDQVRASLGGLAMGSKNRRVPSFTCLEYQRLEIARQAASGVIIEDLQSVVSRTTSDQAAQGLPAAGLPGLLAFVHLQRQGNGVLANPGKASGGGKVDQGEIVGEIVLRPQYAEGGTGAATGGLFSNVTGTPPIGPAQAPNLATLLDANDLLTTVAAGAEGTSTYSSNAAAWTKYVNGRIAQLKQAEARIITATSLVISAHVALCDQALEEVRDRIIMGSRQKELPNLQLAQNGLANLARDLAYAQLFFRRAADECVQTGEGVPQHDARLIKSAAQRARIGTLMAKLGQPYKEKPPKGWFFSGELTALLVIGFLAFAAIFLIRTAPVPLAWPFPWTLTNQEIVGGLALGFVVLLVLQKIIESNRIVSVDEQRENDEAALFSAWSWLVVCQQAEDLWKAGEALTERWVGTLSKDAGKAQHSAAYLGYEGLTASAIGGAMLQLENLSNFVTFTQSVAQVRLGNQAGKRPHVVDRAVPNLSNLQLGQIGLNLEIVGGYRHTIQEIRLDLANGDRSLRSTLGDIRTQADKAQQWDEADRFCEAAELILQGQAASALPVYLSDLLQDGVSHLTGWDLAKDLADKLEKLAQAAVQREFPAHPQGGTGVLSPGWTALVIPGNVQAAAPVNQALAYAQANPGYTNLSALVQLSQQTIRSPYLMSYQVGEAIGVLQFAEFDWDGGAGGVTLADFTEACKQHYAILPGANPAPGASAHHDYNEVNTEFYILPALAAAASIELKVHPGTPLPAVLVPRLYGSSVFATAHVPTLLELFYLARTAPSPPWLTFTTQGLITSWSLTPRAGGDFPLVSYNANPHIGALDPLGEARPVFILLDTFIAAMGYNALGGPGVPQWAGLNINPVTQHTQWQAQVGVRDVARAEMVAYWQSLITLQSNANDAQHVYEGMWTCARGDAALIARPDGNQGRGQTSTEWEGICRTLFNQGLTNAGCGYRIS